MPDEGPPRCWPVRWALGPGIPAVLIVGVAVVWDWDWFTPLVEPRVSAAIGRDVTLAHLHADLGRRTRTVADDVQIADLDGLPATTPFAQVAHLGVTTVRQLDRRRWTGLPGNSGDADRRQPAVQRASCL